METSNLELGNLMQGFRLSYQTEGKSPKTIEWYATFLEKFRNFLERRNFPTDVSQIHKSHIREFIGYLQTEARTPRNRKPLSGATVQGYVRTLKAFYSWATREEYIETNPVVKIPIPKAPIKLINTFSSEHIAKLLGLCHRANENGYRNLTILLLLLDSGLRVSELVYIDLSDIYLAEVISRLCKPKETKKGSYP